MNRLKVLFSGFVFMWRNRNNISNVWDEVVDVREKISEALADKKITVAELKDITREVYEVLGTILQVEV